MRRRFSKGMRRIDCDGWIVPENGFATRPCKIVAMSDHEAIRQADQGISGERHWYVQSIFDD